MQMAFSISILPPRSCRLLRGRPGLSILSALLLLQAAYTERSADRQEISEDFSQAETATSDNSNGRPRRKKRRAAEDAAVEHCRALLQVPLYWEEGSWNDHYLKAAYIQQLGAAAKTEKCTPVFEEWGLDPKGFQTSRSFMDIAEGFKNGGDQNHTEDPGLMMLWELRLRQQNKLETEKPGEIAAADDEERKRFFPQWAGRKGEDVTYVESNSTTHVKPQNWTSTDERLNYDRVRKFAEDGIEPIKKWALNVRNLEGKADDAVAAAGAADYFANKEVEHMAKLNGLRQEALSRSREEKLEELKVLNKAVADDNLPLFNRLEAKVRGKMSMAAAKAGASLEGQVRSLAAAAEGNQRRVIENMKWIKKLNDEDVASRIEPKELS